MHSRRVVNKLAIVLLRLEKPYGFGKQFLRQFGDPFPDETSSILGQFIHIEDFDFLVQIEVISGAELFE